MAAHPCTSPRARSFRRGAVATARFQPLGDSHAVRVGQAARAAGLPAALVNTSGSASTRWPPGRTGTCTAIVDLRGRVTDRSGEQLPAFCLPDHPVHGNLAFGRLVVAELLDRGS